MIQKGRSLTQIVFRSCRFTSTATHQIKTSEVNGYRVLTATTSNPVPYLGVVHKAGSRFDSAEAPGLSYVLQQIGFEGNLGRYASSYLRPLEQLGVDDYTIERDREDLVYRAHIPTDSLEEGLSLIFDAASQARLPWEEHKISENAVVHTKKAHESSFFKDPSESVHANAYRGQSLAIPLYPKIADTFSPELIQTARQNGQISFVGSGIDHNLFAEIVQKITTGSTAPSSGNLVTKNTYVGGGELRIPTNKSSTYAQVVYNGTGHFEKNYAELAVAVEVLGQFSPEGRSGNLLKIAESAHLKWASADHVSYSDAGLLIVEGVVPSSNTSDIAKVLNSAVLRLQNITKEELNVAKDLARYKVLLNTRCNRGLFNFLKKQSSSSSAVSIEDILARIDAVTTSSFKTALEQVSKSRPIVYAAGNVHPILPIH